MSASGGGSKKRKVGFSSTNTVHTIPARDSKRSRYGEDDDDAADTDKKNFRRIEIDPEVLSGHANTTEGRLAGYSLDSDEEDDEAGEDLKSRYELKDEDEHVDLDTGFTDGGHRVTGFNLEEEEEEGHFDAHGNYHFKKEKENHEGDNWLEYAEQYVPKPKVELKKNYREDVEDPEQKSRRQLLEGLLKHMKPHETTQQAMRRLGGSAASSGGARKWQSLKKKKGAAATGASAAAAPSTEDTALFNALTGYADELLSQGEYDVYTYSYEKVSHDLKVLVEEEKRAAVPTADDKSVKFEYKWTEADDAEVYGPFTVHQMIEWQEAGHFKDGVFCREVKEGKNQKFYNSKRVDFELYTD
eukprot:m.356326 g.356326  ORF g.356326 m.356326 type:complete len:357 (+) comp20750_c1_seq1:147-1217(+)